MTNSSRPQQYFDAAHRAVVEADTVEWEELPSLAQRVVGRGANDPASIATGSSGMVWDNTLPASFDPAPPSQPFSERIEGLASREVHEPDVFRHFFGAFAASR